MLTGIHKWAGGASSHTCLPISRDAAIRASLWGSPLHSRCSWLKRQALNKLLRSLISWNTIQCPPRFFGASISWTTLRESVAICTLSRSRSSLNASASRHGLGFLRKYKWAWLTRNYLFTQPSKWTVHSRKHGLNICHIFAGWHVGQ